MIEPRIGEAGQRAEIDVRLIVIIVPGDASPVACPNRVCVHRGRSASTAPSTGFIPNRFRTATTVPPSDKDEVFHDRGRRGLHIFIVPRVLSGDVIGFLSSGKSHRRKY